MPARKLKFANDLSWGTLWADAGHQGPPLRSWLATIADWGREIVRRPSAPRGFPVLPQRWMAERAQAWLGTASEQGLCRTPWDPGSWDSHRYDGPHAAPSQPGVKQRTHVFTKNPLRWEEVPTWRAALRGGLGRPGCEGTAMEESDGIPASVARLAKSGTGVGRSHTQAQRPPRSSKQHRMTTPCCNRLWQCQGRVRAALAAQCQVAGHHRFSARPPRERRG